MTPYDAADPATHPQLDGNYRVLIRGQEREALWQGEWWVYEKKHIRTSEITHWLPRDTT